MGHVFRGSMMCVAAMRPSQGGSGLADGTIYQAIIGPLAGVRPTIVMVSAIGLRLRSHGSVTPTAVGGQPGRGALSAPRSGAAVPVRCHATAVAGSISQS